MSLLILQSLKVICFCGLDCFTGGCRFSNSSATSGNLRLSFSTKFWRPYPSSKEIRSVFKLPKADWLDYCTWPNSHHELVHYLRLILTEQTPRVTPLVDSTWSHFWPQCLRRSKRCCFDRTAVSRGAEGSSKIHVCPRRWVDAQRAAGNSCVLPVPPCLLHVRRRSSYLLALRGVDMVEKEPLKVFTHW